MDEIASEGEVFGVSVVMLQKRIPGSDPALLRLWYKPAAVAPVQLLTWEFPFASVVALKRPKKKRKRKSRNLFSQSARDQKSKIKVLIG